MRLRAIGALALLALIGLAYSPAARAQGGRGMGMMQGGPGMGLFVLTTPEGEKELNITADQKTKLSNLQTNFRTTMRDKMQSLGQDASMEERQAAMKELGDSVRKDLK